MQSDREEIVTFIVSLFNPAALPDYTDEEVIRERWADPFEGIEILGFADTEDEVNEMIDRAQKNLPANSGVKFHYEQLPDSILGILKGN